MTSRSATCSGDAAIEPRNRSTAHSKPGKKAAMLPADLAILQGHPQPVDIDLGRPCSGAQFRSSDSKNSCHRLSISDP